MNERLVGRFLDEARDLVSGVVGYANLAAFKWRNQLLGFEAGDAEIADLEERLRAAVAPLGGRSHRVAGDAWLIVVPAGFELVIKKVVEGFTATVVNKSAGWRGTARLRSGETKVNERFLPIRVERGVRIAYASFESAEGLRDRVADLEAVAHLAEVNVPTELRALQGRSPSPRWRCFEPELPGLRCPGCEGTAFSWTGGADDCAEGTCVRCGAEVDFRYF